MAPCATHEIALAQMVGPRLQKGMLCLADRFFPGYELWQAAANTGADLLWHTRRNARLEVDRRLPALSFQCHRRKTSSCRDPLPRRIARSAALLWTPADYFQTLTKVPKMAFLAALSMGGIRPQPYGTLS